MAIELHCRWPTSASIFFVDAGEIERRLATWSLPAAPTRGYGALYRRSVLQAPAGCDFDFLTQAGADK